MRPRIRVFNDVTFIVMIAAVVLIFSPLLSFGLDDPVPVAPVMQASPDVSHPGQSVNEFILPDGRFDLDRARMTDIQGSLNIEGYNISIDPATGNPLFMPALNESAASVPDDIYWDNSLSSSIPGVNGNVLAMTVFNGSLIVGGSFSMAGNVKANNIAAWDGTSWSALGTGTDSAVQALAVYNGKLIAGGRFTTAGGSTRICIASWNGSTWSALGSATALTLPYQGQGVKALAVYDGKLFVGGDFQCILYGGYSFPYIVYWNGSSWNPLGSGLTYVVMALTVYDNKLVAGGYMFGGYVQAWNGSSWTALGSPDGPAFALTVYNGNLIAGGDYYLKSWNGASWATLGSGLPFSSSVKALAVHDNQLIIGVSSYSSATYQGLLTWDGASYSTPGSGTIGSVYALAEYNSSLMVGGSFADAGGNGVASVASWNGSWSSLGSGTNSAVRALAVYDNKLIAGGSFTAIGGVSAKRIAAWDGMSWSALGSGMNSSIYALAIYENKLIAGGNFTTAGGVGASQIAAWDGTSWSALGSGIGYTLYYSYIDALAVYDNKLIAGGYFVSAGGNPANYIAAWNGTSWSTLGSGMNPGGAVAALTVYDNQLVAGGSFSTAGGNPANYVATWDGSSWSTLGTGMNSSVVALTVYDNKLIAGGAFSTADGNPANNIAAWDGSSWSALGSGMDGTYKYVYSLSVYDNQLIAGGYFTTAGGNGANRIAAWDGTSWSAMGSGLDGVPFALTNHNNYLIVAGSFFQAGDKTAPYLARWSTPTSICGDADNDGLVTSSDIIALVNFVMSPGAPAPPFPDQADADGCGSLNLADAVYIQDMLLDGGPNPCEMAGDCLLSTGTSSVTLGCPLYVIIPSEDDTISVPIYITNDVALSGLSLGFNYNSVDIELVSLDLTGSIVPGTLEYYIDPVANEVLIGYIDVLNEIPPQTGGLLANLRIRIPAGIAEQTIDFDSVFIAPAGEFMFSASGGGIISPAYEDCGTADITLSYSYVCGDANNEGVVNILDITFLISFLYKEGPEPEIMAAADVNSTGNVNILDVTYLISFLYKSGPDPDCQ